MTDISKEFVIKVRGIYDDYDYVMGMLALAPTDDKRLEAIEFINTCNDIDDEKLGVHLIKNYCCTILCLYLCCMA